jgi:hypothetical protein
MPPKSKITLSDSQKRELCLYARSQSKMTRKEYVDWIEKQWAVRVDESTVTRILQKSEDILNTEVIRPNAKRHKSVTVPELELALKEFILTYQDKAILSEAILIEKAKQLAVGLEVPDGTLKFSAGWLQKFKERNEIRQQRLHGEASSVDLVAMADALPLLKSKCENYPPERIYNMDETGLFYRLEPDRSLATQRLSGRKKDKERLSIAFCTNADGSHKLNPLIIGKFAKPRCFINVNLGNLPMTYRNNSKAWMLTTLFQDWLQKFDKEIAQKYGNQRVLLLLDNCPSHKTDGVVLSNTDVHFLPPNTTSKIQPMDAGIIMSFKRHYRNLHIRWILTQVEKGNDIKNLKMNVLQAIQFIIRSWDEVTPETIRNCWNHTKILPTIATDSYTTDSPTLGELTHLLTSLDLPDAMPIEEFLSNPEEREVYVIPNDKELVELYRTQSDLPTNSNNEEADDSTEPEIISVNEASKSLEVVYNFLLQQGNAEELFKHVKAIDKYINVRKTAVMKQATMDQFFNNK